MIDCDRVFGVLTRGPFPTGAPEDAEVESHLAACAECARLAAALRPAIELFEEAVGPDEGRDLPSYWGDAAVEQPEPQLTCAPTVGERPSRRRRAALANYTHVVGDLTSAGVWRVAALVALGMFIGSVVHTITPLDFGRRAPAAAAGAAAVSGAAGDRQADQAPQAGELLPASPSPQAVDAERRLHTEPFLEYHSDDSRDAWVRLPLVCLDDNLRVTTSHLRGNRPWVERQLFEVHCCTHCHNATLAGVRSNSATSHVQASCRHCHAN